MKKNILTMMCIVLIIGVLCSCGEELKTDRLGSLQIKISSEWEKVENKEEDSKDYLLDYKYNSAELRIDAIHKKEVGSLEEFEENVTAGYGDVESELLEIDNHTCAYFDLEDKEILHIQTSNFFYILTYTKSTETPEDFTEIIKRIKIKE